MCCRGGALTSICCGLWHELIGMGIVEMSFRGDGESYEENEGEGSER